MAERLHVTADLTFSVEVDGQQMCGALRGTGSRLELSVSDPELLGGTGTALARELAGQLAGRGVEVAIVADRPLVTLGVRRVSGWRRRASGSPHIRVASVAAAVRLLRLRRRRTPPLLPPPSPLPLLPTFLRRPRRPTLTHDPDQGGYPRLVVPADPTATPPRSRTVHQLGDRVVVGSDPGCDLVLEGLAPQHAVVRRTPDDEFVVTPLEGGVRVDGAPVVTDGLLRTGRRVELGGWTLGYFREEYADHGRPYGGRVGGELGYQRRQPPREAVQRPQP